MNERELGIRVLAGLSSVREDMLALIDLTWDGINPRDAASREAGNKQIDALDRQLKGIDAISAALADLFKQRTGLANEELPGNKPGEPTAETDLLFAGRRAHGLDEDLTSTKPIGYIFQGKAVKNVTHWKEVYIALCKELARRDPARFASLADNPRFVTGQGNLLFSQNCNGFNDGRSITDGVYAETNLSVPSFFGRLKKLLGAFGIPQSALQFYLQYET